MDIKQVIEVYTKYLEQVGRGQTQEAALLTVAHYLDCLGKQSSFSVVRAPPRKPAPEPSEWSRQLDPRAMPEVS